MSGATRDSLAPCRALAERLIATDDPSGALPKTLPCRPIDLLVALHGIVAQDMGSAPLRAQRAAAAAWVVVQRRPEDPLLHAQAHWSQASAVLYLPEYAHALSHYDLALEWYDRACALAAPQRPERDVPVVHVVRVFCLSELGRYSEAQQAIDLAERWLRENPNAIAELKLLLNRSQLAFRLGDNSQALALADRTIASARRARDRVTEAQAHNNRALAHMMLGQLAEAELDLAASAQVAAEAGELLTLWRVQLNRALLCRLRGQLFEALRLLRQSEQQLAQLPNEAAVIALDAAAIYEQLRQLHDAQAAAHRAADLFAEQSMLAYSAGAALRAVHIAIERGEESRARGMLRYAQSYADQIALPTLQAELTVAEARLATLPTDGSQKIARRKRQSARVHVEHAVTILAQAGLLYESIAGQLVIATLATQLGDTATAIALYQQFITHPNPSIQLAAHAELGSLVAASAALPYLQRAATLAVEQRRALPMEELQARYSSETSPYHLRLAEWYLNHAQVAMAFESISTAKAGPLLDLRAIGTTLSIADHTAIETAKATLSYWRRQQRDHERAASYAQEQGQAEQIKLSKQLLRDAKHHARDSEHQLTSLMRSLGDRSGQVKIPTAATVKQALPLGTALLEYAQRGDQIICFLLQRDQAIVYQELGAYQDILALLDYWHLFRRSLRQPTQAAAIVHERMRAIFSPLRERLLDPWRDALGTADHVLIAPWGVLHQVPWAALLADIGNGHAPIPLSLTPASALWCTPLDLQSVSVTPPRVLACEGTAGARLEHIAAEVTAICAHFPHAISTMWATAADMQVPSPQFLHIAAHGSTNSSAPLYSAIELADGPFLLLQAHRLNLRGTQLVTLSACETGVRPDYGDMVLALAGAFLCAGARAVLASLWEVDDAATATLMRSFYAALAAGRAPALALQQAQNAVREAHPLDWPAFQLWAVT